jgi:hypothetical protein
VRSEPVVRAVSTGVPERCACRGRAPRGFRLAKRARCAVSQARSIRESVVKRMAHAKVNVGSKVILLAMHTSEAPGDDEWAAYMADMKSIFEAGKQLGGLAITDGGGPSSRQRNEIAALVTTHGVTVAGAAVTNNPVVRGIMTVLSWLMSGNFKAYAPNGLDDALKFLGVEPDYMSAVREAIARVQQELPPLATMSVINEKKAA